MTARLPTESESRTWAIPRIISRGGTGTRAGGAAAARNGGEGTRGGGAWSAGTWSAWSCSDGRLQADVLHDAPHRIAARRLSLTTETTPDLAHSMVRVVLLVHPGVGLRGRSQDRDSLAGRTGRSGSADFGPGYRIRRARDWSLSAISPTMCSAMAREAVAAGDGALRTKVTRG